MVFPEYCKYCMADISLTEMFCNQNTCNRSTYKCVECPVSFTSKEERDSHLLTHIDFEYIQICLTCGKKFKSNTGYSDHCAKMHGIVEEGGKKCYNCDQCEKFYFSKSRLAQHRKSHSDKRDFHCKICGKEYKYKNKFKTHMRDHGIYLS